jgi:hypothetical protein
MSFISSVSLVWIRLEIDAELFLRGIDSAVGLGLGLRLGLESVLGFCAGAGVGSALVGGVISGEEHSTLVTDGVGSTGETTSFPIVSSLPREAMCGVYESVGATDSSFVVAIRGAGSSWRGGVAGVGEETSWVGEAEGEEGFVMVSLVRLRRCERVKSCCGGSTDGEILSL